MNWKHYLVLFGLFGLFCAISLWSNSRQDTWLASFAANLSSGFLASLLTAWLIDRSLARDREKRISRTRQIAFSRLRPILFRHINLLIGWFKAASTNRPSYLPVTFSEVFTPDFYDALRHLDFSKNAPTVEAGTWLAYSMHSLEAFRTEISRTVDKYAVFMEPRELEFLEELAGSSLVAMVVSLGKANIIELDERQGFSRTYNLLDLRDTDNNPSPTLEDHFAKLESFLEYYNELASNPIHVSDLALWQENTAPKFGSARLDEPSDIGD